jgi:hypothetical protein
MERRQARADRNFARALLEPNTPSPSWTTRCRSPLALVGRAGQCPPSALGRAAASGRRPSGCAMSALEMKIHHAFWRGKHAVAIQLFHILKRAMVPHGQCALKSADSTCAAGHRHCRRRLNPHVGGASRDYGNACTRLHTRAGCGGARAARPRGPAPGSRPLEDSHARDLVDEWR